MPSMADCYQILIVRHIAASPPSLEILLVCLHERCQAMWVYYHHEMGPVHRMEVTQRAGKGGIVPGAEADAAEVAAAAAGGAAEGVAADRQAMAVGVVPAVAAAATVAAAGR